MLHRRTRALTLILLFHIHVYVAFAYSICELLAQTSDALFDQTAEELSKHTFYSHLPKAGQNAGKYSKVTGIATWEECVYQCCGKPDCDVVLFTYDKCYHISCDSSRPDACQPVRSTSPKHSSTVMVVLRKRTSLDEEKLEIDSRTQQLTPLPDSSSLPPITAAAKTTTATTLPWSNRKLTGEACMFGLSQCVENAECVRAADTGDIVGRCGCKEGHSETPARGCEKRAVTDLVETIESPGEGKTTTVALPRITSQPPVCGFAERSPVAVNGRCHSWGLGFVTENRSGTTRSAEEEVCQILRRNQSERERKGERE